MMDDDDDEDDDDDDSDADDEDGMILSGQQNTIIDHAEHCLCCRTIVM